MQNILQALERAKSSPSPAKEARVLPFEAVRPDKASRPAPADGAAVPERVAPVREPAGDFRPAAPPSPALQGRALQISDVAVSTGRLEKLRVVAHDVEDPRSRAFDRLRTHVLQAMAANGWRTLAITSPTAGCGKTFTAINLTLSVARQPDSSALLVDLDLKKPQVAQRLGIGGRPGIRALLEGRASLDEAITRVSVVGWRFGMLPCERPSNRSSDWFGSVRMQSIFQSLKADPGFQLVVVDLPPMLSGDEVISLLPHVDCVLMVAAAGTTKTAELKECAKLMGSTPLVRVVLNRDKEAPTEYY